MKKPELKAVLIKPEVHRIIQLSARYFSCTQSEFIDLLLKFGRLTDSDNVKQSSVRLFEDHLDYYQDNQKRKPGLQEFLNQANEDK